MGKTGKNQMNEGKVNIKRRGRSRLSLLGVQGEREQKIGVIGGSLRTERVRRPGGDSEEFV